MSFTTKNATQPLPVDVATLIEQLVPLSDMALEALRLGLEERNPAVIKIWLHYLALVHQHGQGREKDEMRASIKFADGTEIEI